MNLASEGSLASPVDCRAGNGKREIVSQSVYVYVYVHVQVYAYVYVYVYVYAHVYVHVHVYVYVYVHVHVYVYGRARKYLRVIGFSLLRIGVFRLKLCPEIHDPLGSLWALQCRKPGVDIFF